MKILWEKISTPSFTNLRGKFWGPFPKSTFCTSLEKTERSHFSVQKPTKTRNFFCFLLSIKIRSMSKKFLGQTQKWTPQINRNKSVSKRWFFKWFLDFFYSFSFQPTHLKGYVKSYYKIYEKVPKSSNFWKKP